MIVDVLCVVVSVVGVVDADSANVDGDDASFRCSGRF